MAKHPIFSSIFCPSFEKLGQICPYRGTQTITVPSFPLVFLVDAVINVRQNQVRITIASMVARLTHEDTPVSKKKVNVGVVHAPCRVTREQ